MEVSGKRVTGSQNTQKECGTCKRKRSISRAAFGYCTDCNEYLCDNCYQVHRDPAPCSNHKLLTGKQMPKKKLPPFDVCASHTKEKIQYYCKGHSALACQKCVILRHRMCADVCDISTVSSDRGNRQRREETIQKIDELETKIDEMRHIRIENVATLKSNKKQLVNAIESFCESIHEHVYKLEKMMIEEVNQVGEDEMEQLDEVQDECDSMMAKLSVVRIELETNRDLDRAEQLFIAIEKAATVIATFDDNITTLHTDKIATTVEFQANDRLQGILNGIEELGCLKFLGNEDSPKASANTIKPVRSLNNVAIETDDNINIRTKANKEPCRITGSTLLDGGTTLALADWNNDSVKLVDLKQKRVTSEIQVSGSPFDITQIRPDQLAVTLPGLGKIQFLSYSGKSLSLGREIKVSGMCRGIAHHNDTLFVSFDLPTHVQILNMSGSVLKTISAQTDERIQFETPYHLTLSTDRSKVYVSDYSDNTVTCLELNGRFISKYTHPTLQGPYGMCTAEDGSLIVCCRSSHNIQVLSSDGRNSRVLADTTLGVRKPDCVEYSRAMSYLYVWLYGTDGLKAFKFK